MQMPDLAVDSVSKILDPVAEANPWLKPFFDVLTSTITDKTEMALEKKLDDLTKTAATSPDQVNPLLPEAVQELAESAPPHITQEAERRFGREVNEIRGREVEVQRLSALLDRGLHPRPVDPHLKPPSVDDTAAQLQKFVDGLHGWVVTKNPNGDPQKIFVHMRMEGMFLKDLRYIAKESPDGMNWDVYKVGRGGAFRRIGTGQGAKGGGGGGQSGGWIGTIARPTDIEIGECSCN